MRVLAPALCLLLLPARARAQSEPASLPAQVPEAKRRTPPSRRAFEDWLAARPTISDKIIWEGEDGPQSYPLWPESRKAALFAAALKSFIGAPDPGSGPAANLASGKTDAHLRQVLSAADAEALYLDSIGHSLSQEIMGRLPWSIARYGAEDMEILFDSRQFFRRAGGNYEIETGVSGRALPSPAAGSWAFLKDRLGPSRRATIVSVLDWLRQGVHFEGKASWEKMSEHWQYAGFPPVSRVLSGTPYTGREHAGVRPRMAGCSGTAGFLRALLRAANIPVRLAHACGHFQAFFPTEASYLSHGDDPYNGNIRDKACAPPKLLIDAATYRAWFKQGSTEQRCENVGRGAIEAGACEQTDD